jgi:hypothetical protein
MSLVTQVTALATATLILCQCGIPQPPQCTRVPKASRVPADQLLSSAQRDWATLGNPARKDEWPAARTNYNDAVAKLFDQLRCGPGDWDARAAAIGTRIAPPSTELVDPAHLDALFPASVVNTKVLKTRKTLEGVGVPIVGWKKTSPVGQHREAFLLPTGLPYSVTATLDFDRPGPPQWNFGKRWNQDSVAIRNTPHPHAADWSAANAFFWRMCELDDLTIQNVFLPDRFTEETALYFLTPYDPEKIPIVFVHGLVSSPDAFKNLLNEIFPEPWFRERYQVWLYNYPTGNPWIYSSAKFREVMRDATDYARSKGHDRNLNQMVVVSHSMGGLLTRSSVSNPGTTLYDANFKKPLNELNVTPGARKLIADTTLYQPLTEPKRVVFMAVPHRGSPMATIGPAVWISKLIRLPKTITVELLDNTISALDDVAQGENPSRRLPTSISSLSPYNPSTLALNELALPEDITFHSVIGDRGRGNSPESSDGVVPYWSSRVEAVADETIVPSNHGVPDHPAAAEELKRILKSHLEP